MCLDDRLGTTGRRSLAHMTNRVADTLNARLSPAMSDLRWTAILLAYPLSVLKRDAHTDFSGEGRGTASSRQRSREREREREKERGVLLPRSLVLAVTRNY